MADRRNNGHPTSSWTFLNNHTHVLVCIAADPEVRMRDVAIRVGITERAVQRIVAELEAGGYITITREGRRNRYTVNTGVPLRHELYRHRTVGHLIDLASGGRSRKG